MNEGAAQEAEKERSKDSREDTDRPLPVTTASGTNVSQVVQERPRSAPSPSPSYDKQEIQPSFADLPTIADDTSVLPVPSHAVLHHLCTSAIKNGMLAVGGTVRYRKKFATTIYYKPTS
ncbi:hypothetical protein GYMLUDRAFT_150968 [Collybiopsis luxurians FD-317 M1]|nr:hypothetical protein GYMLUDRAFT_150968 [Collybiopsis luxurians FD-317 M1]